jgi:hypothetical protein
MWHASILSTPVILSFPLLPPANLSSSSRQSKYSEEDPDKRTNKKKIFACHIFDKRLSCSKKKNSQNSADKETNNPVRKWVKDMKKMGKSLST